MDKKSKNYKWLIDTTGSDTYGTQFSKKMSDYLQDKYFEKIFDGSPLYGTVEDYEESAVEDITKEIINMRKEHGQNLNKIKGIYFRVTGGNEYNFSNDDIEQYKNDFLNNREPLAEDELIKEFEEEY